MKRFILLAFSVLLTFSFAIAQDGINYQGAATDANGDELTNQSISIRASVLSASASGNLEWEETHSATTDQFGLFNVVIGQGTNTTNGATATFDDMDWGSGNHFLKIEMDATGGTNYAMIGTTQMMSVPYALYAKSAGIDSTMLANMIGSSGGGMGGGCDYNFPEGLDGEAVLTDILNTNYTIPNGKNFYLISTNLSCLCSASILVNGLPILESGGNGSMNSISGEGTIVLTSGDVISHNNVGSVTRANIYGLLVDKIVDPILLDIFNTNYTVPSGKNLYIRSAFSNSGAQAQIQVNGTTFFNADNGTINSTTSYMPFILNSGDVLSYLSGSSTSATMIYITGYLADENYFANCGGGGSSSSASSVDSAMVAGMIAASGGSGSSFGDWELIFEDFSATLNNTIKWGQSSEDGFLYLMDKAGSGNTIYIYTDENVLDTTLYSGVLDMDKRHDFRRSASNYYETKLIPIKANSYWSMDISGGNILDLYFLPLEGGGSSSASTGLDSATVATMIASAVSATNSSTSVSTIGDTLYVNGQAIVIPGISYQNTPSSAFGSVTDIDGNTYQTVNILGKEWMMEDLRVTRFNNGDFLNLIPFSSQSSSSSSCTTPSYRDWPNFGGIVHYNGHVIMDSRNICPSGWHVPTELDYVTILDLFDNTTVSFGTSYNTTWDEAGPALKKNNDGNWSTSNQYPFAGQTTNYSYLGFVNSAILDCTFPQGVYNASSYTPNSWTATPGGNNGGNWILLIEDNSDRVDFSDGVYSQLIPCRCVKD